MRLEERGAEKERWEGERQKAREEERLVSFVINNHKRFIYVLCCGFEGRGLLCFLIFVFRSYFLHTSRR